MKICIFLLASVVSVSDDSFSIEGFSSSSSANSQSWTHAIDDNASEPSFSIQSESPENGTSEVDLSDWHVGGENTMYFDIGDSETNQEMEQLKKQIAELKQQAQKDRAEREELSVQLEEEKEQRKGIEERLFTMLNDTNQRGSSSSSSAAAQMDAEAQSEKERHITIEIQSEEESTPEQEESALSEETPESASSSPQIEDDEIFARQLQEQEQSALPEERPESALSSTQIEDDEIFARQLQEQEESALSEETPESASSSTQIENDEIFATQLQESNHDIEQNVGRLINEAIERQKQLEIELFKASVQALRNVVENAKPCTEQVAKQVVEEAKPHVEKAVRDVHRGAENAVKDIRRIFRF